MTGRLLSGLLLVLRQMLLATAHVLLLLLLEHVLRVALVHDHRFEP